MESDLKTPASFSNPSSWTLCKNKMKTVIITLLILIGCSQKMIDIDVKKEFSKFDITSSYSEDWEHCLVHINASPQSFNTINESIKDIFKNHKFDYTENDYYEHKHSSTHVIGPNSTYKHRWQIEVRSVKDEEAKDDLGSYLNIDLDQYVTKTDKYIIVIYDNVKK